MAIGLKNRAPANQLGAQFRGIDEIAVVAQGNLAVRAFDQERLGIDDPAVAGCRVTDMTDRGPSDQAGQYSFGKDVADVTHGPRVAQAAIVGDRDASALLPAVLLRVQAQVGNVGRVLVAVNPKDAARIFEFVHGETAWCRMLEILGQPGRPVLYYLNLCCMSQAVHLCRGSGLGGPVGKQEWPSARNELS